MSFKDSVFYNQLHNKYGDYLAYILLPWYKFAYMDSMTTAERDRILFYGSDASREHGLIYYDVSLNYPNKVRFTSSSAQDTLSGTGASSLRLTGLDKTGFSTSEELQINGAHSVTGETEWVAINGINITGIGSSSTKFASAGNILVTPTTSSIVVASLEAGHSQSSLGYYSVGPNETLCITDIKMEVKGSDRNDGAYEWSLWKSRQIGRNKFTKEIVLSGRSSTTNPYKSDLKEPLILREFEQFWILIHNVTTTLEPIAFINGYVYNETGSGLGDIYNKTLESRKYNPGNKVYDRRYRNPNVKSALWTRTGNKWRYGTNENL